MLSILKTLGKAFLMILAVIVFGTLAGFSPYFLGLIMGQAAIFMFIAWVGIMLWKLVSHIVHK